MSAAPTVTDTQPLGAAASGRIFTVGAAVGGIGLVLSVILGATGGEHGWEIFFRSYLFAFMTVLAVCLGGLFFVIVQHITRAGWSVAVRRFAESIAGNLTWLWILFLPLLGAGLFEWGHLYHWQHPEGDPILEHKAGYLNPVFWTIRAVIFLAAWAIIARLYTRHSIAQDTDGDVRHTHTLQYWAPVCVAVYALTQTFAMVDWVMSLSPHWFSTMFGVNFFAVSATGFYAVLAITMYLTQRAGRVRNEITKEHFQDVGKLLFAFGVVFWAYICFSQFMLIWYANIPEETTWYITRQLGGWAPITWFLLIGHFFIPFVILITKHTKRATGILALIAGWMVLMHLVDVYWLVMPVIPEELIASASSYEQLAGWIESNAGPNGEPVNNGFAPHLLNLTCLVGIAGLAVGMTARAMGRSALIPLRDPRLDESLAFENV